MARKNKILIRTGSGAPSASDFVTSEPAWDSTNGKLYVKSAAGTMVDISGGGGTTYVYEYATTASFPATGTAARLYIATDSGRLYHWTGSEYAELGAVSAYDSRWDLFVPAAPTSLAATAGFQQASLTWAAPTVSAQTPITDYVVQYSSNGGSTWTTFADGTSTTASATVTGLTNNTQYSFRVQAVNGVGSSAWSSTATATPAGDPYWTSVSLLLHGDGTGATITDSSSNALTVTANGAATQSATQSKFGGKSIYFDQSSNTYLSVADADVLDFGTSPFTVEFWFYPTAFTISGNDTSLMAKNGADSWPNAWGFDMNGTTLHFYVGTGPTDAGGSHGMSTNNWYHIAATRDASNVCRLFVGGVQKGSATVSESLTNANALIIGSRLISGSYGYRLIGGYLDDIRITAGQCRYASNYTPPTAAFPNG